MDELSRLSITYENLNSSPRPISPAKHPLILMLKFLERFPLSWRPVIVLAHVALVSLAYLLAFLLRFDFSLPAARWNLFLLTLPLLLVVRMAVFGWFHLYEGLWRYVSMWDIVTVLKAGTLGSLVFSGIILIFLRQGLPRSVLVLEWILCLALVGGVRLALRALRESRLQNGKPAGRRILMIGAGDAGEMLIREIERNTGLSYEVIGFVDDDPKKHGRRIHGIEVLGYIHQLSNVCKSQQVEEILFAIPSATEEQASHIIRHCQDSGIPFKTVPPLNALLQGKAGIGQLREVKPEDLLGRDPIRLDVKRLQLEIGENRILITGAAGCIGSELSRQVARFKPEMLLLFDRSESNLYFINQELQDLHPHLSIVPIVGDILDRKHIEEVIRIYGPQLIYHAAAYKHVPLMEEQPFEAINNNVFGTEELALAARHGGVKKFVLISTDKAVKPVGIMGMTKRMAEGIIQSCNGGPTIFVTVRFGNVLGSDGSVLPLFRWQIAKGGPVTVTDPDATRYFMLISEAAQLVLQAGAMGKGGEIFFLDMGEPVRIGDLAENMIRLSGFEPGKEIPIEVIGLRPGERLSETLIMDGEELLPTEHGKVFMVENHRLDAAAFCQDFEFLRQLVVARDRDGAIAQLRFMAACY